MDHVSFFFSRYNIACIVFVLHTIYWRDVLLGESREIRLFGCPLCICFSKRLLKMVFNLCAALEHLEHVSAMVVGEHI
jgi:hypothetical protein